MVEEPRQSTTHQPASPDDLMRRLSELNIATSVVSHPPLFTVDDSKRLRGSLAGGHCKNLFLKNKKGSMWLVVCGEDRVVDLKSLGERIGAGRVSFASPERLFAHLGVTPGAVTPFAVINDHTAEVKVVLDSEMMAESLLNFHPLTNDMTAAITPSDLLSFLSDTGHVPQIIDLQEDLAS